MLSPRGHLPLEPVDSAGAKARLPRSLDNAYTLGQFDASAFELIGLSTWAAEASARGAGIRGELAVAANRSLDGLEPGMHALPDHAALELGETPLTRNTNLPMGVVVSMFC
jgi:hypothetical protein